MAYFKKLNHRKDSLRKLFPIYKTARNEAQKRWRSKNQRPDKPVLDRPTYWRYRRFNNLINAGIIIPEIEEELEK